VTIALVGGVLGACSGEDGGGVAAAVEPTPVRDNSTPEAAAAAIYAEWHERDPEGACAYFDPTFEETFDGEGDCEVVMGQFDEDDLDQMADVTLDGSKVRYFEDGTAFVPAIAVSWPDGRLSGDGGMFVERENGWFRTFEPHP
jgi:hypothetical protein